MKNILESFCAILNIELNDLNSDIEFQLDQIRERRQNGNITNYVFMENQALYKNMLHAMETFKIIVDNTKPMEFQNLDELIENLKEKFANAVEQYGYAKAAIRYTDRKLKKVAQYVNTVDDYS